MVYYTFGVSKIFERRGVMGHARPNLFNPFHS